MKITKGIFVLLCSFISAAFIISLGAVIFIETNQSVFHGGLSDGYDEKYNYAPTLESTDEKYYICEFEGNIGVFDCSGKLLKTINTAVITLPMEERKRLSDGFWIDSYDLLEKVIENYTG